MKSLGSGKKKEDRADRIMRMTFACVSMAGSKPGGEEFSFQNFPFEMQYLLIVANACKSVKG